MKRRILMMISLLLCMTVIQIHMQNQEVYAQSQEWECDNCGRYNPDDYNFCGNCGTMRPKSDDSDRTENVTENIAETNQTKYVFGKQVLYFNGDIYVAGDNGIERRNSAYPGEQNIILVNDAFTDAFFETDGNVYFVKYSWDRSEEAFLYRYNISKDEAECLCSAGTYGSIVGAEGDYVYFIQNSQEDYLGNELVLYDMEKDETTILEEHIGTAYFWNGSVIYTGFASDVRPVSLYMIDSDGNRELITEYGSQNIYVENTEAYYVEYEMQSGTEWNQASIYKMDGDIETKIKLLDFTGSYVVPVLHGKPDDNLMISCNHDGENRYYLINTLSVKGQPQPMDVPDNATSITLFKDKYGNKYYYTNGKIYYWKGAGYKLLTEVSPEVSVISIAEGYVLYRVHSSEGNPRLFVVKCSY